MQHGSPIRMKSGTLGTAYCLLVDYSETQIIRKICHWTKGHLLDSPFFLVKAKAHNSIVRFDLSHQSQVTCVVMVTVINRWLMYETVAVWLGSSIKTTCLCTGEACDWVLDKYLSEVKHCT